MGPAIHCTSNLPTSTYLKYLLTHLPEYVEAPHVIHGAANPLYTGRHKYMLATGDCPFE